MTALSQLPPIEDLWTPTGGFDFNMDDMPSELKLWSNWSNRIVVDDSSAIMAPTLQKKNTVRMSIAESNCDSCGISDFELRCRSCGTASMLFLDENEQPVLPAHACPSLEMSSSRPSTTGDQAASDASDATSLFSTPSFGSARNETPTPSEGVESAVSPRTAQHVISEAEQTVEPTLIGLPPSDDEAFSPKTIARKSVPEWVSRSDCAISAAMAAVYEQEQARHERDFGLRSRSSTISSTTSRSIKRKAVRQTSIWTPSEGASSSSAAPSVYQGEASHQAPVESMIESVMTPTIQTVATATPQIEIPVDMPAGSVAEPVTLSVRMDSVLPVGDLVKELHISPTDSYFPTSQDLTYAALAPLPPSPTASSVYSTDSYTEDEEFETPNEEAPLSIGTAIPYKPYRSEPLPTPNLRTPTSSLSRTVSSASNRSPRSADMQPLSPAKSSEAQPMAAAAASTITGAAVAHLASQKQALAQPASATEKKWFEKPHGTEMKFKFVLTPRNGAKTTGGKKAYVLPACDEDGRIIEPSAPKSPTSKKSSDSTPKDKKAEEGSSGPIAASSASGMPGSVSLAQLARDPNELQRLLACTMFLLNDVPDKDAAPKKLDLGVMANRSAGGYAMKHQLAADHEKEGMAAGMKNVKWRVSMLG